MLATLPVSYRLSFISTSTSWHCDTKPATINHVLAAVRGRLREAWRLGLIDAETLARVVDVGNVKVSTLPAGCHVDVGEVRRLFEPAAATAAALATRPCLPCSTAAASVAARPSRNCSTATTTQRQGPQGFLAVAPVDALVGRRCATGATVLPLESPTASRSRDSERCLLLTTSARHRTTPAPSRRATSTASSSPATTGPAFHCLPPLTSPIELECPARASSPSVQSADAATTGRWPTVRVRTDQTPAESRAPPGAVASRAILHAVTLQQFLAVSFARFVQ